MSTQGIEPLPGRRPVYPVDPAEPPLPQRPGRPGEAAEDPASDENTEPANHPNDDE